jgi:hypothetical protein
MWIGRSGMASSLPDLDLITRRKYNRSFLESAEAVGQSAGHLSNHPTVVDTSTKTYYHLPYWENLGRIN